MDKFKNFDFENENIGLSSSQVEERIAKGLVNIQPNNLTRSVKQIVKDNLFTLFNLLNLVLALIILIMGDWKNALFIGVAVANTAIGILQELRFKKTIDKLSILNESKVHVLRDKKFTDISHEELVLDDIIYISQGEQIPADGIIYYTENMEVDESLLTGEANQILKKKDDEVLSGSFITSGNGLIRITAVGKYNYATKLSMEAKGEKDKQSQLMKILNNIIRVLTIVIVPIGLLLFYSTYSKGADFRVSILGATAAMLGMIPEGLILLTSVTFAVGAINLAKYNTLVQALPSIETLARVDVLCLDKTGTITDGELTLESLIPVNNTSENELEIILSQVMNSLNDNNPTANAIKKVHSKYADWQAIVKTPFSSSRKWSGVSFKDRGSYLIGAPEFLFNNIDEDNKKIMDEYINTGFRVLAIGFSNANIVDNNIPEGLRLFGFLILSDNLRKNAVETFKFFEDEGVELKVISGDNPVTVSKIAKQANITGSEHYIDMSKVDDSMDFKLLVDEYTVFGRVSPYQKRELVKALQGNKKTVCMTGDGVNDVLALKEADCGVSMVGGSQAARSIADFVLLDDNFNSMTEVLKEGRRVINNIENVSSLYLIKTIYSTILSLLFIYLPFAYPFSPLQMGPINGLTVGVPSFILALEANYRKPKGKFLENVLENSVPAAITVIINILIIQLAGKSFNLKLTETSTMSVLLTGVVGFILLIKVSKPLNWKKNLMIGILIAGFLSCFTVLKDFFDFESLFTRNVFFYLPLVFLSKESFKFLNSIVVYIKGKYFILRDKLRDKKA